MLSWQTCSGDWCCWFHRKPFAERLVDVGTHVKVFVRYNSRNDWGLLELLPKEKLNEIEVIARDSRDSGAISRAIEGVQVIFHLGSLIAIPYTYIHPRETIETNVMGTMNIMYAAKDTGVDPPDVDEYSKCSFNYYTILLKDSRVDRNELRKHLESKGIQSMVYYPLSLHLQEVYKSLGYRPGDFPKSESAQDRVLSLPMYPELRNEQIEQIVGEIRSFSNG